MSKMSDISIEIQERLAGGQSPEYIAKWLEIPIQWVKETQDMMEEQIPNDFDPYNTINS